MSDIINDCDPSIKDLSKTGVKRIKSLEELINRSIDNCSLTSAEGKEILKRLKKEKGTVKQETKEKLLDIAEKGGWIGLASVLKSEPVKIEKSKTPEPVILKLDEKLSETKESKNTKIILEYIIKSLISQKGDIEQSKKWDSLNFWNKTEKRDKKEILTEIINSLGYLKSESNLTGINIKKTIEDICSTSEGNQNYRKNRENIKNDILQTYFDGEKLKPNIKQISVEIIRENLGNKELKEIFKLEFGKEYVRGMTVSNDKKWLLEAYENAFDTKDEFSTFSDETKNQATSFLAYDVTSMVASGLGTGAIIKGGSLVVLSATRGIHALNNGSKIGKVATVGTKAIAEGTIFTALQEGIRNQKWFLNQDDVTKKIIQNSLMFGTFSWANSLGTGSFTKLASIQKKNPIVDGLVRQGLIAPAMFLSGMMSYDTMTGAEQKEYKERLKEFILTGILAGTFHLAGAGKIKKVEGLGNDIEVEVSSGILKIGRPQKEPIVIDLPKSEYKKLEEYNQGIGKIMTLETKDLKVRNRKTRKQKQEEKKVDEEINLGGLKVETFDKTTFNGMEVYYKQGELKIDAKGYIESGKGKISMDNHGKIVEGTFEKGILKSIKNSDGTIYEGTFNEFGKLVLKGKITYKNGEIMHGNFENGVLINGVKMEGKTSYEGIFNKAGRLEGQGIQINPDGVKLEGVFKDGTLENGIVTYSNGTKKDIVGGKAVEKIKGQTDNYLLDIFKDARIEENSQGFNRRLSLRDGAKKNIQIEYDYKTGNIKKVDVIINGEKSSIKVVGDEIVYVIDNIKDKNITLESIKSLLNKYLNN